MPAEHQKRRISNALQSQGWVVAIAERGDFRVGWETEELWTAVLPGRQPAIYVRFLSDPMNSEKVWAVGISALPPPAGSEQIFSLGRHWEDHLDEILLAALRLVGVKHGPPT